MSMTKRDRMLKEAHGALRSELEAALDNPDEVIAGLRSGDCPDGGPVMEFLARASDIARAHLASVRPPVRMRTEGPLSPGAYCYQGVEWARDPAEMIDSMCYCVERLRIRSSAHAEAALRMDGLSCIVTIDATFLVGQKPGEIVMYSEWCMINEDLPPVEWTASREQRLYRMDGRNHRRNG